jgi:hypothetical protein
MHGTDGRLAGVGSQLCQRALQPFAGRSEGAKRISDGDAPIRAANERAGDDGSALRQAGLMQSEGALNDVGDAVGQAFALLIFEGRGVAARRQKALLEMLIDPRRDPCAG